MFAWIARLAARRVVWIVVGLVVYAALGAVGVRAAEPPATASVTVAGAANTASTVTLPAGAGGEYHCITHIAIRRVFTAALAGGAVLTGATTNLGGRSWRTGNQGSITVAISHGPMLVDADYGHPLRSSAPGTATLISLPAPGAGVSWHSVVDYYLGDSSCGSTVASVEQSVALSAEDRARLDDGFTLDGYIATITALLLTAILVVTGLRR